MIPTEKRPGIWRPRTMNIIKKAEFRNHLWLGLSLTNLHLPGF